MKYEKNNAFADWLYNCYVTAMRNREYYRAPIYLLVLQQYTCLATNRSRHVVQKQHAEKLILRITDAIANRTVGQLKLTGNEAISTKLNNLRRDERLLYAGGIPQKDVEAILTLKLRGQN